MDRIKLTSMQFYGHHGVFPEETKLGQRFLIDVEMEMDLAKAGQTDQLENTVNYAEAYDKVKAVAEGTPYKLIEALAERVATELLQSYTSIHEITVRVVKPHPPFDAHFDGVTVEIHRKQARS